MAFFDTLSDIAGLVPAAQTLLGKQKKPAEYGQANQYSAQQAQYLQDVGNLVKEQLNPNSQLVKSFVNQEVQNNRQSFQQGLADLIRQNRRQMTMGRTPLFDAERGAENIYRAIQMGNVQGDMNARNTAMQRLQNLTSQVGNAATGYGNAATGMMNQGQAQMGLINQRQADMAKGYDTLSQILSRVGKQQTPNITWSSDRMFTPQQTQVSYQPSTGWVGPWS